MATSPLRQKHRCDEDASASLTANKANAAHPPNDLITLEEIITEGLPTFVKVGRALLQNRDRKLYRNDYATFAEYCEKK